jgi:hypothetical protein
MTCSKRLTLTLSYGTSMHREFRRKTQFHWSFSVIPGIELLHFAVLTCSTFPSESSSANFFSTLPPPNDTTMTTMASTSESEHVLLVFDIGNRTSRSFEVFCDTQPSAPTAPVHPLDYPILTRATVLPSICLPPHSVQRYTTSTKISNDTTPLFLCSCFLWYLLLSLYE